MSVTAIYVYSTLTVSSTAVIDPYNATWLTDLGGGSYQLAEGMFRVSSTATLSGWSSTNYHTDAITVTVDAQGGKHPHPDPPFPALAMMARKGISTPDWVTFFGGAGGVTILGREAKRP